VQLFDALIATARQHAAMSDETPIDEAWLRSIGFGEPTINGWPLLTANNGCDPIELWLSHDNNVAMIQSNTEDHVLIGREFHTRGQLLALLAALGGSQ
jgi:hypothetical protein